MSSKPSVPFPTIERATPEHLDSLLVLIGEFCEIDQHPYDECRLRQSLPPLLESDDFGVVWRVVSPSEGYAVVTWGYSLESGGREALIDELYLRRRGEGLGAKLVSHILHDCRRRGLVRIFLETESHNERVRGFYAAAGFEEDDSVWMSQWL